MGQLSKDLGHELTPDQLDKPLIDLDLNKDGVVDLNEFKRWYFTGLKPYNGSRRTMLKFGAKSKAVIDVTKDVAINILLGQELKTISSSFSVGLNVPENPNTEIKADEFTIVDKSLEMNSN